MLQDKTRIISAMSGGVDSSAATAMLVEQGHDVIGIMLRLWSDPEQDCYNKCCSPESMQRAKEVASILGIPFYVIDAKEVFRKEIVQYFIDGYSHGITPNPCLKCNSLIRWDQLLARADALDAEYIATGHYAKLIREEDQPIRLFKGSDSNKDQSYVLSVLDQRQLSRTILPVGEMTKPQVRDYARKFSLPSAEEKDSQDLCFLGLKSYEQFLEEYSPESVKPGTIMNMQGDELGEHKGLIYYTIGQRKRIGIAHSEPLFVIDKDTSTNSLIVGEAHETGKLDLLAENANWVSGITPSHSYEAEIMIRYRSNLNKGTVTPVGENGFKVEFKSPVRQITPGQAAVIYQGDEVIGSGLISKRH